MKTPPERAPDRPPPLPEGDPGAERLSEAAELERGALEAMQPPDPAPSAAAADAAGRRVGDATHPPPPTREKEP